MRIDVNAALQAHPEFLNEQIDDHDKAIYAKGWNDCNKEYYNAISELPAASIACTDFSTRLRRAFEADELVNQRILLDAADAIEELLRENGELENSGKLLAAAFERLKSKVPRWTSVKERLPEKHQAVLFYIPWNKTNMIGWVDEGGGINLEGYGKCYDFSLVKPSHWMPLPEPPKGVE